MRYGEPKPDQRGLTLIETLVVFGMFSLLGVTSILVFTFDTRSFQQGVVRLGSIGEVQTITRTLGRDLTLSHFNSVQFSPRTTTVAGIAERRDGLSLAALSDWQEPANFNPVGLPNWNRWVVIYANRDEKGSFFRLERAATAPLPIPAPMDLAELNTHLLETLTSGSENLRVTTLSTQIKAFQVDTDPYTRLVRLNVTLQDQSRRGSSGVAISESIQIVVEKAPRNSFAEL